MFQRIAALLNCVFSAIDQEVLTFLGEFATKGDLVICYERCIKNGECKSGDDHREWINLLGTYDTRKIVHDANMLDDILDKLEDDVYPIPDLMFRIQVFVWEVQSACKFIQPYMDEQVADDLESAKGI